jgi:hypothetical protein
MFARALRFLCAAAFCLALNAPAQAESLGFPQLFAKAMGIAGQVKTERNAETVHSPYGGSYTIDYGTWSGNSGTVTVTYSNFVVPYVGWIYNGSWTYTGSIQNNGYLNGALVGSWQIDGLNLGSYGTINPSYSFNMNFSNGMASGSLSMSMSLNGMPYNYSVPLNFSQDVFVSYLL